MIVSIRTVGQNGIDRYKHIRHLISDDRGKPRWHVEGQPEGTTNDWQHILWADSEEHALLAVLFLTQGGACKINGNVLTDDLAVPRRHYPS